MDLLHEPLDSDPGLYVDKQQPDSIRRSPLLLPVSGVAATMNQGNNGHGPTSNDGNESEKSGYTNKSASTKRAKNASDSSHRRSSEWEILEGLKEGQRYETKPVRFEGYLLKRRKWPLKGWHKRYFALDRGILNYTKTPAEMAKGKVHSSVDVGLSVISTKLSSKRIDIDAEEFIYHIKSKTKSQFTQWVAQLRQHRLFRQHELNYGNKINPGIGPGSMGAVVGINHLGSPSGLGESYQRITNWILDSNMPFDAVYRELADFQVKLVELSSLLQVIEMQMGRRKEMPDIETGSLKKYKRRFLLRRHKKNQSGQTQSLGGTSSGATSGRDSGTVTSSAQSTASKVTNLVKHVTGRSSAASTSGSGDHSHLVARDKELPIDTLPTVKSESALSGSLSESDANPSTAPGGSSSGANGSWTMTRSFTEVGKDNADSGSTGNIHEKASNGSPSSKAFEDFLALANEIHSGLRTCLRTMQSEREGMKRSATFEADSLMSNKVIASLQSSLHQALAENTDMKAKLNKIHDDSDLKGLTSILDASNNNHIADSNHNAEGSITIAINTDTETETATEEEDETDEPTLVHQPIGNSKSYESCSVLSISEYFDAAEKLSTCSTSSDDDDDGSLATDVSEDDGVDYANAQERKLLSGQASGTGRRSKLPASKPDAGDVSLWGLLCKNIGKDLSKISMPVTLNEPLNMLQRLCEELEYSELLDKAASLDDPCERMIYVAAFAVSAYGSATHRAGHKPFNPLLGETYECVREDKRFRFLSEQVSHHPPVSACHAESEQYVFWQDMRIKTKFWGKSMEIIPFGNVHLSLKRSNSRYKWNKVTTCVHNIFKGQRWVDQYGEMIIEDEINGIKASVTFVKASYWSNKKHEVFGVVTGRSGDVLEHLFGKWDEALYAGQAPSARCIWRPGAMPQDNQQYYGFSRFALELNELTDDLVEVLPPTDTRFRPDQRLLEEARIQDAEAAKSRLEALQREKRRQRELTGEEHEARWFRREVKDGQETWSFTGDYWKLRDQQAFKTMPFDDLWPAE